jgi:alpha-galactosidase
MQEFNGSVGNTADNTSTEDNYDYDSLTGFSTSKGLGIGKIHINVRYIIAAFAGLIVMVLVMICILRIVSRNVLLNPDKADDKKLFRLYNYLEKLLAFSGFERLSSEDYQDYIYRIIEAESSLQGIGLEKAVQTILEVRFGNVKCVDKADITGIINTIRQVRSYALKKARGLKKLIVCLI